MDRRVDVWVDHREALLVSLDGAVAILILGPGEARTGLEARLRASDPQLAAHVRRVEPADKLTEPQLVARTREFFGLRVR